MPSPPSDGEAKVDKNTTLSETPGEPHGENQDTSELPPKNLERVSAVSNKPPSGPKPTDKVK